MSRVKVHLSHPSLSPTKNEGQFRLGEFGEHGVLFLTPELAAQWIDVLTPLAAKAELFKPGAPVSPEATGSPVRK